MLRCWILLLLPFYGLAQPDFDSGLPLLLVDTESQEIVDDPKVTARLRVINRTDGGRNHPRDAATGYDGFIGIELRGSTSQTLFPKKGYGFETRDAQGKDIDVDLLGMPEEEDWVLHGPYSDKTLIRNALTYHLAGQLMDYAPRARLVELILNGEYWGVYLLTEKIKRDKHRVDISRLTPDEDSGDRLTGGYLLKFDKATASKPGVPSLFLSRYGSAITGGKEVRIFYDYPDPERITTPQRAYIRDFIHEFEGRLAGADFTHPTNGYRPLVDLQSFVDFLIINEVSRNIDGYRLSSWMYKDRDSKGGKLHMGPVWDFNLAFGNANYCEGSNLTGWAYDFNAVCPEDNFQLPFWWERFRQDPVFLDRWRSRWEELRAEGAPLSDATLDGAIDSLVNLLQTSGGVQRNFDRWPVEGVYVWPNEFVGTDYPSEVDYLRNWIDGRMRWLDQAVGQLDTLSEVTETTSPVGLFPNPTPGTFRIDVPSDLHVSVARIYDATGRQLFTGRPGQLDFDLSGYPRGMYTVVVVVGRQRRVGRVVLW